MTDSIGAYDVPERVVAYDADMEVMHPLRAKMIGIALEVLPFETSDSLTAIDLGVGTGFFTDQFLNSFPRSRVIAIDGAVSMLELARSRLSQRSKQTTFVVGDFRNLAHEISVSSPVDVVFSSYALHHLTATDKAQVVGQAVGLLRPDGWFLNADLVAAERSVVERRIQELRVSGVVWRAAGNDRRFQDEVSTRAFLDDLEAKEGDQPLTLAEDLRIAREAGLENVEVFWKEYREVVFGGPK